MAIAAVQEKLHSLPPVPTVANEILRVINDQGASLLEISKSLEKEPGLTARIVSLANTAFFARQRPVYSVDDAVVRLGMKRVKVLATSILLSSQLDISSCHGFCAQRYWFDAVRVAFCANRLAPYVPVEVPSDATYLAGLLHNFGMLLIAYAFPHEYSNVLLEAENKHDISLCEIERRHLGFDHHDAGGMLLEEWKLPAPIITVVHQYNNLAYDGPYARFSRMIRVCVEWSKQDFADIPRSPEVRGVPDRTLAIISHNCQSESEQLQEFANMLSGPA